MSSTIVDIKTKDGVAACHFFAPPEPANQPPVILYMDAFGIRPGIIEMAQRLASNGFNVLLPDLYYRSGVGNAFNPATAFKEGPERDQMMGMIRALSQKRVMDDTASFLDFLGSERATAGRKVGCVGYCMGGGFALSAAGTFPDRVAAAASLHGGRLATDQPDSPHLLALKMRAAVYVGIAGLDTHFTPEERQRLESALQSAGVRGTVEFYLNAKHGFAVNDSMVFDRAASELHWRRILRLFEENLK